MKEKDLFPTLKKHFKDKGYTVFAEVPCFYRGVDFVAAKGSEHIAVEMKLSFNYDVVRQAHGNITSFGTSYVAYPVKKPVLFHKEEVYWKLRESIRERYDQCRKYGIGIIQVLPKGTIFIALDPVHKPPYRVFDFSQYRESEDDEAGLPFQKGVSSGYMELKAIKEYVLKNPKATWKEIFNNVQNHYANQYSLAGSMKSWRGFDLKKFKEENNLLKKETVYETETLFTVDK